MPGDRGRVGQLALSRLFSRLVKSADLTSTLLTNYGHPAKPEAVVTGGDLGSLRRANRAALLALLRESGPLHRAALARQAHLSRSAVSTIVADLLEEGFVTEVAEVDGQQESLSSSRGHRGGLLTMNPMAGLALGVDFSYACVRVVLADLAHTVLAETTADLVADQGFHDSLELAVGLVDKVLGDAGGNRAFVLGAGLGVPGPVHEARGEIGAASNSAGWEHVRAVDDFTSRLGVPVAMDNTSHLASLAEVVWGAGAGYKNVIYLKLSTGIGAGLMLDGRIFRGAVGSAGEIGHVTVDDGGPACRCGNRGCLEVYAGVPAVVAALRPALGADLTISGVLDATAAGNRACLRVLSDVGGLVGRVVASACNLLNPEIIIVGGDLAAAGDALILPLAAAVRQHALPIATEGLNVVVGHLGARAGALGAVALVLREGERFVSPDRKMT